MPHSLGLLGILQADEGEDPNDMPRYDREVLKRSGLVTTNAIHPAFWHPSVPDCLSNLLPVGTHAWLEPRKVWEMLRADASLSAIGAAKDRTHQSITVKLRRSRRTK